MSQLVSFSVPPRPSLQDEASRSVLSPAHSLRPSFSTILPRIPRILLCLSIVPTSDLCVLTGLPPAGLLCELVAPDPNPTGSMAKLEDCLTFAKTWKLETISVEMIRKWREEKGL